MRWDSGALYLVRRLTGALTSRAAWMIPRRWFWVAFVVGVLVMLAAPQMAKATGGPTLQATSITGTSRFGTGLSGQLNAVLIETERRSYHNARVTISGATLGAAARAGMRGVSRFIPYVGLAMTAAEIAGWQRDGDWFNKNDGDPGSALPPSAYYICANGDQIILPATYCVEGTAAGATRLGAFLMGKSSKEHAGATVTSAVPGQLSGKHNVRVTLAYSNGTATRVSWQINVNGAPLTDSKNTDYRKPTLVTEAELLNAILNQGTNTHRDLLHDVHGAPHMFPEVAAAMNGMAASIGNATGTTPGIDGETVDPNTTDPTDPDPTAPGEGSELPAFCEWANVVCEFIEWYKEDEPLEKKPVEWDDDEVEEQTWVSPIASTGSCPAPEIVSVWGSDIELSYQPLCDFVSLLRYVIILGATLMAAYIVAGVRGSNV